MRVYLAGPMRGHPNFNHAAFHSAAYRLRWAGREVFSPAEHSAKLFGEYALSSADGDEGRMGGEARTIGRTVFHIDLTQICLWADAIALLPGWEASKGASAEAAVGRALGIVVEPVEWFVTKPMPWPAKPSGWVVRKPPAVRKPTSTPEWILQAAMISEFHKCKAEGYKFRVAGDMNAGKRSGWASQQAKVMGMNRGEPDIRLYAAPGRLLLLEVKTVKGKVSDAQDLAHDEFSELGFKVLVVAPKDIDHARELARNIADEFVGGAL